MAVSHKLLVGIITIISSSSSNAFNNTTMLPTLPSQLTTDATFLYKSTTDNSIAGGKDDEDTLMGQFRDAFIGPQSWLYTVSILSGIVIGLCLCAFLIYRHKTKSHIVKSKSEPPEPFELALTLTGNSMGKKSKKHEIKILPSLTPDNSAKNKQTLDSLDTPSPDDYGDDEMDFGKKVSKLSTKLSTSGAAGKRLKFQKVKSTDSSREVINTHNSQRSNHQYNNTANTNITGITNITNTTNTATLATMVIHGDMTEPPPNDQSIDDLNVDESDTQQSQNDNDNDDDDDDDDEHENTNDDDDDIDDDEEEEDMAQDEDDEDIGMDHLGSPELKSGYGSATGLTSEYEYENEWYEPTLTDQGNDEPILKQCDSDAEISTTSVGTEDLRKQIEKKIQNKDKKQLKKLSQALEIIKDDRLLFEESENGSYNDNAMSEYPDSQYPDSQYPVSDYAMSTEYDMKSDNMDNITNDGHNNHNNNNNHDNNNKTMIELDGDGYGDTNNGDGDNDDEKITKKRNSPRNDMIIFGDDETTNYGIQQAENDTISDDDDDGEYQWLIDTLLRIDKKDGKKIINTFKENKVTDDRLKDLREQDWRDLIPQIGTRNELRKLHELEFPPSEGRGT